MALGSAILTRRCLHEYDNPFGGQDPRGRPRRCRSAVMLGSRYCWRHGDCEYAKVVRELVPRETRPLWRRALEGRA